VLVETSSCGHAASSNQPPESGPQNPGHRQADRIELARDEAFRKIGRNTVSFRKMEAMRQENYGPTCDRFCSGCEEIVTKLDEQWERTRAEAELLSSIVRDIREYTRALGEYLQTEQFKEDFRRAREG
jgi:hypothetical protein